MKKFLFLFLITVFSSYGEIIEVCHFQEIKNYLKDNSFVLLDIDDTLLIPKQTLGNDAWFLYRLSACKEKNPDTALDKTLAEWEAIRHLTEVKTVEENTSKIVAEMQNSSFKVMGLTTQGLALATRTISQLRSLDIDLSKTAPSKNDFYFINGDKGVLYRQGVLFTSGTKKGKALLELLSQMGYSPKHIVFINDKRSHLEDVEKSVLDSGLEFTGLRYGYGDSAVSNFNSKIADIQWNHSRFCHILSDEEAAAIYTESISKIGF